MAVHFPGLVRESWEFDRITDPYLLFNAIEVFRDKLGVLPEYPQKSSRAVLEASWGNKWPRLLTDDPESYWEPFIGKMESEFIWLRAANAAEKEHAYTHAFDKRMMFLSAARGGMFGPGEYETVENIKYSDLGKAVGIVELENLKFGSGMQPEFAAFLAELFSGTNVFYTPYLQVINDFATFKIKRGWIWREPVRIFEKYSKTLGDAIKETRTERIIHHSDDDNPAARMTIEIPFNEQEYLVCNKAFKSLYTMFFGWLGRLENRTGYAAELFRPDWRGLIVAGAGANLLRNVLDVYNYTGKLPFGINHDCLMYFSDERNWKMDFDKTAVADPNRFTHEWTAPAEKVSAAIAEGLNAMQLEKAVQ